MFSILSLIQDDICKYADAISGITGTDVEIVDENLKRIAGTGWYRDKLNINIAENGYIYRHVISSKQTVLITDPGENALCHQCEKCFNCSEMLDLNAPIFFNQRVIGVIGIICLTLEQRNTLLGQIDKFIKFIERIAELISSKAFECMERLRAEETLGVFRQLIEAMDRGVVAINSQQTIWHANLSAMRILNQQNSLIGQVLGIEVTGDSVYGDEEAFLILGEQRYHVLCRRIYLSSVESERLTVIIFQDARDFFTQQVVSTPIEEMRARLVGSSAVMQALQQTVLKIAVSQARVLITGESGSGKEVVACAIHQNSPRRQAPFITINCAAIPEQLLESELFGYVKGAFSGADPKGRVGKFELAHGGSLFLDEIGDMPMALQAKLLRVLQDRSITRIGSNQLIHIDVRIIAATNKNIMALIDSRLFREDLYYRLNVVPLQLPALRHRREDIAELANYFADELAVSYQRKRPKIPEDLINRFYLYHWPGNVRELRNVVEYMFVMLGDSQLFNASHLPASLLNSARVMSANYPLKSLSAGLQSEYTRSYQREQFVQLLRQYGWDVAGKKQVAAELGIGIATLYRRIKKLRIQEDE